MLFTIPEGPTDDQRFMMMLFQKYRLVMYSMAQRYTTDPQDCEDVLQDAIESLYKKIPKLRKIPENALSTYILTTVKNTTRRNAGWKRRSIGGPWRAHGGSFRSRSRNCCIKSTSLENATRSWPAG